MTGIRLLVGLGNPGQQYVDTRHNAGFWLLDQLAVKQNLSFHYESKFQGDVGKCAQNGLSCWLLKPSTFMNLSGLSLANFASFYRIPAENILVVHDDLDFAPGIVRLKSGGGLGGHNGLKDIAQKLQTPQFWRLRLGIGRPSNNQSVHDYVLKSPQLSEQVAILRAIEKALQQLDVLCSGDFHLAMNQLHQDLAF